MKYHGMIGFCVKEEDPIRPSVHIEKIIEREYKGDVLNRVSRWQSSENLNDSLNVTNRISIVSNKFLEDNLSSIRYIVLKGVAWKVNSITLERPRMILEVGGVYNGERPD